MLHILIACLFLTEVLASPAHLTNRSDPFIVGGTDAKPGDNPHQCSIRDVWFGGHKCGASIISDKWLLTAAHCLDNSVPSDLTIRCGTLLYDEPGLDYSVAQLVVHPSFSGWTLDYDIGLIRIRGQMTLGAPDMDRIAMIAQDDAVPVGVNITITGWGGIYENGPISPTLQTLDVPVIANAVCAQKYVDINPVTDRMFCAGVDEGGLDACQGDSGGPVVLNKVLVGIISWGEGCARANYPGVYTRIAKLRDWIKLVTDI